MPKLNTEAQQKTEKSFLFTEAEKNTLLSLLKELSQTYKQANNALEFAKEIMHFAIYISHMIKQKNHMEDFGLEDIGNYVIANKTWFQEIYPLISNIDMNSLFFISNDTTDQVILPTTSAYFSNAISFMYFAFNDISISNSQQKFLQYTEKEHQSIQTGFLDVIATEYAKNFFLQELKSTFQYALNSNSKQLSILNKLHMQKFVNTATLAIQHFDTPKNVINYLNEIEEAFMENSFIFNDIENTKKEIQVYLQELKTLYNPFNIKFNETKYMIGLLKTDLDNSKKEADTSQIQLTKEEIDLFENVNESFEHFDAIISLDKVNTESDIIAITKEFNQHIDDMFQTYQINNSNCDNSSFVENIFGIVYGFFAKIINLLSFSNSDEISEILQEKAISNQKLNFFEEKSNLITRAVVSVVDNT